MLIGDAIYDFSFWSEPLKFILGLKICLRLVRIDHKLIDIRGLFVIEKFAFLSSVISHVFFFFAARHGCD